MTQQTSPRIRFLVDDAVRPELVEALEEHGAEVASSGLVEDPGKYAFDFGTVATVVTFAQALLFNGAIIPEILQRLRRHGEDQKLVVEGPFGRVELGLDGRPPTPAAVKAAVALVAGQSRQPS